MAESKRDEIRTCCPHIRNDPERRWVLAFQQGLVIQLDDEGYEQLLLCPACAAIVEGQVLHRMLSQAISNGIRQGHR